jgi:hypothetical protein
MSTNRKQETKMVLKREEKEREREIRYSGGWARCAELNEGGGDGSPTEE